MIFLFQKVVFFQDPSCRSWIRHSCSEEKHGLISTSSIYVYISIYLYIDVYYLKVSKVCPSIAIVLSLCKSFFHVCRPHFFFSWSYFLLSWGVFFVCVIIQFPFFWLQAKSTPGLSWVALGRRMFQLTPLLVVIICPSFCLLRPDGRWLYREETVITHTHCGEHRAMFKNHSYIGTK